MGDIASVLVGVATITIGEGVGAVIVGYTADGATMTIRSDFADIKVEELAGTIKRVLTDQRLEVTLNMAEGSLANMAAAIPGASLDVKLTLGGGELQETKLTLVGLNPLGGLRTIILNAVNPVGEVGIPYKKDEISVVPVTFAALVDDDGEFGEIEDAAPGP